MPSQSLKWVFNPAPKGGGSPVHGDLTVAEVDKITGDEI
jgi:hypothetical protein